MVEAAVAPALNTAWTVYIVQIETYIRTRRWALERYLTTCLRSGETDRSPVRRIDLVTAPDTTPGLSLRSSFFPLCKLQR
jgi:hypothetical protein